MVDMNSKGSHDVVLDYTFERGSQTKLDRPVNPKSSPHSVRNDSRLVSINRETIRGVRDRGNSYSIPKN